MLCTPKQDFSTTKGLHAQVCIVDQGQQQDKPFLTCAKKTQSFIELYRLVKIN